ncbi:O-methyltransferase [Halosquirtibacter laminarini]|uniref:O-methyltransferase n=1 Tax=Halosquirtibacter laminarini TaxID=3374600 RepID=A0AC61NFF8_9BACT|nr:O-methyltransferase [Prolixibacteraceae bacterium]
MHNSSLDLEQYILNHIDNEDPILSQLDRDTHANVLYSRMCSGHLQGSILTFLSKLVSPQNILELGTFTGYSAISLAKGLKEGGKLHTVEINDELEEFAFSYFEKAGLSETIIQHIGNAEEIVPALDETFDLVFMDADKRRYVEHYEMVIDKVSQGGVILADNTLWDGKVVEPIANNDLQTKGILAFNDHVKNDPRVETTILPLRDGITMLRKR